MSERTTIGNVVYESVGSSNSNLLLKCNGTARIQWGNKLIDLIKNGKIAASSSDLIYVIKDESELRLDGLYILGNEDSLRLLIRKNGNTYNITDSDLYISASNKQQTTVEQKKQALENIGFYYNTLEEVNNANIENGLVYVLEDSNLYIIKDGNITSFRDSFQPATVAKSIIEGSNTSEYENNVSHNPRNEFVKGMIVMYSGLEEIPEGWGICDGRTYEYNGTITITPNLVNRFIKAVSNVSDVGAVDQTHLTYTNEFILREEHLPKHTHPHTHKISVLENNTESSKAIVVSSNSEDNTVPTLHTKIVTTQMNDEEQTWKNSSFKIEPNYYSLIFIIKL